MYSSPCGPDWICTGANLLWFRGWWGWTCAASSCTASSRLFKREPSTSRGTGLNVHSKHLRRGSCCLRERPHREAQHTCKHKMWILWKQCFRLQLPGVGNWCNFACFSFYQRKLPLDNRQLLTGYYCKHNWLAQRNEYKYKHCIFISFLFLHESAKRTMFGTNECSWHR